MLDATNAVQARETAVIIAESPPGSGCTRRAGSPGCTRRPHYVLAAAGGGSAIIDLLHPFEPGLLIDGEVPEDAWTRVARHGTSATGSGIRLCRPAGRGRRPALSGWGWCGRAS
jgi:hypothetical protein